jgi:polyisoprenyl-teichoic acid--peptidoglycan teichoic acid transferase
MAPKDVAVRPRRSAFAAAFLSFLFPGLGHAYLGRWLRALAWAVIPVVAIAAIAGRVASGDLGDLVEVLANPAVLDAMLVILVIDAIYRLLALLDAYRLASDRSVGSSATRAASAAGLVALVVVLVGSHVVVARPVFFATDLYADVSRNAGDDTEVISAEELAGLGEDWQLLTEEQLESAAPDGPQESPSAGGAAPSPTPEPTIEPTIAPAGADWNEKERLNILLIGHDGGRQGRGDTSLLTDTMITVSVDPTTGRLAFISLPRDTSGVPLPRSWPAYNQLGGKYNNKINTLYYQARANPSLFPGNDKERGYLGLMGALGELYGLDIKYYVAVNLNSFRSVVNTLGGVIVDVQLPVMDTGYATADGRGKLKLYIPPGMTRMNGQDALAYARSRHGSSDYDRAARQQRVITSVREQSDIDSLLEPGVLADLINELKKDVKTNIPPKLVPAMLSLAQKVDLDRRENLVLGSSSYVEECYPCGSSGLWMLKAKPGSIKQAVQNVFSTTRAQARAINAIREEGALVHVLNGQGGPNTKAVNIASHLGTKGIDALVPPLGGGRAESDDFANTVITFYNGAEESMPETASRLTRTLKDKGRELRYLEDEAAAADIVITVGAKTEALKP